MPYVPSLPQIPNRYAAAHANPQGEGDARPTALQIIQDEGLVGQLNDKVALVTGGTNGIGVEIVRHLAKTGMKVFFTSRDFAKGEKVKSELESEDSGLRVQVVEMELKSLKSVERGAEEVLNNTGRLDVLVNNAGIAATPRGYTEEGYEQQFGVNHLAHFYLFQLLKPLLLKTAADNGVNVRVVTTSSTSHTASTVRPENDYDTADPNGDGYEPGVSYAHSNTAKIWFCNEVERRYGPKGVHAISLHPGGFGSGLMESSDEATRRMLEKMIQMPHITRVWKSVPQGAATNLLAAVGKEYDGVGGFYMEDCGVSKPIPDHVNWSGHGFKSWAFDEEGEKKLWEDSLKMVGLDNGR
ncbi:WW domain-containing oxidoreductase [Colletotrichum tanaceti]|uniref:WW domain-containing oxidoreductase n=1 Tax=Colletotrichum tanaceti TaxID=1306861 RepID=A0A4U6XR26_9PEZI|nr:WW domain-containing oxidoreductase [Colletotrichum tanaceti]TKW58252.1 WW domain-containing oxidoreductase [Colletotrichum tanaceti]